MLPANTLVFTFASSSRKYYVPDSLNGLTSHPSFLQSPDYNSDTEVALRGEVRHRLKIHDRGRQRKARKELKSASVNDLLK